MHLIGRRWRGAALGLAGLAAALAILLVLAPGCGIAAGGAEDPAIASFRGGPEHAGVYQAAGAPDFGGVRFRVATEGPVRSSPAVAGGRIFFGSADGHLYALDREGREVWKTDLGSAVTSSPAVAGERVFVQSRAGEVAALAAATGAVAWRFKSGPDVPFDWGYESGDVYVSSPVVAGGKVLAGSGDGHLYALDADSGRELWRLETGGRVRSSPAIAGGLVFAGSMDGSLYAVELATGRLAWRFDTAGRGLRSATYGFDRKSVQSSPAVVGGTVYFGGRDGFLYAVDAARGTQRWRFDHHVSWVITSPAVWDGKVFAGSSDAGFVQAVDAATGREVWRAPIPGFVWSSPAIAGGIFYVGDGNGALHALDARTGKRRFSLPLGGGILASPVPVGDEVLVGSTNGVLYAIGAGGPLRRAVFWDAAYQRAAWVSSHADLRDALAAHGYEVMDARALAAFMEAAVRDRAAGRAVVVFAIDHLPPELGAAPRRKALLRRFLEAGGKVVWAGFPPLIWPKDPATGSPGSYDRIDRLATRDLLDVDFKAANFDPYGATLTAAGRAWGLRRWWLAGWSVQPGRDLEVLARDENGLAAAWVKRFGGEPGSGFVMLGTTSPEPAAVLALADYRPAPSAAGAAAAAR